jgi:hypothetical protein
MEVFNLSLLCNGVFNLLLPSNDGIRPNTSQYFCSTYEKDNNNNNNNNKFGPSSISTAIAALTPRRAD